MSSMNSPRTGLRVASLIFAIVTAFHVVRLFKHTAVIVGSHTSPDGIELGSRGRWRRALYLDVAAFLGTGIALATRDLR